jgi:hypothetical protein
MQPQLSEADARTRTGDPFITSEVLYQLSYVGRTKELTGATDEPDFVPIGTRVEFCIPLTG